MKAIGILPEQRLSHIDHLVPLCQLMQIPLLVTDLRVKELIERYYPPMETILAEPSDFDLTPILEEYDTFFYVEFFRKGNGTFQFHDYFTQKKARSVMSLHGHPDKYWNIYWIEQLMDEDVILAYGPQLLKLMHLRGVRKKPVICGNYRMEFYKTHEFFFDQTLPFKKEKKTVLYAPTWSAHSRATEQRYHYSSFFTVYRKIFDSLASKHQLIVKLHPQLKHLMAEEVDKVMQEYPEIYFLDNYPPIYPLLKQVDIYLGDYSSIGYDFLFFNRPLFFLEGDQKTDLQQCGTVIKLEELSNLEEKQSEHHNMYSQVFGERKSLLQLKQEIECVLH